LFREPLADSSWSDRRLRLPWEIFAELMRRALRPRATAAAPRGLWHGWRVVALDATKFSLINTPQITTTNASLSQVIDNKSLLALPMNGRNSCNSFRCR
jgi:hypothetical protein